MGHQVVIKFVGLCIHVHKIDFPQLPCEHRVILLANPEPVEIDGHPIDAHQPTITFLSQAPQLGAPGVEPRGPNEFLLRGVRMRITNGNKTLERRATFGRVPHLSAVGDTTLEPDLDVILNGKPPAAAYFDVDHGAFYACIATPGGAIGTSLVIDTDGVPQLEMSGFEADFVETVSLDEVEPRLHIRNTADVERGARDEHFDYLLNYRIFQKIPAGLPNFRTDLATLDFCVIDNTIDFGPACSNSNYP